MPTADKLEYFNYNRIPDAPFYKIEVDDPEYGLKGWIVIHSMGANGACGGVRLYPDVNLEEVYLLARAMTYKYCFFERDTGGAKAGLQMPFDLPLEERQRRLRSFGAHVGSLLRANIYLPWTDMNSRLPDLQCIIEGAGMPTGDAGDSAYYTALSTFAGVLGAAEFYGLRPEDCRITIEGVGNVGFYLAREIGRWGGKIIGASTRRGAVANPDGLDIEELLKLRKEYDDEWVNQKGKWEVIKHKDLFALPMNIHVPCARVHSLTGEIAGLINAKAVVPAANVPCTPDGEKGLNAKGIKLLPDFIINGGGIVGTGIGELGGSEKDVAGIFTNDFKDMIVRLLRQSEDKGQTAVELAAAVSHRNFRDLYMSGRTTPGLGKKLYRALEWRGLIPKSIRKKKAANKLLKIIHERFR
ncbi:MAG: Glu/Leu/Phe/Val dehydrogenase dimerization domain-containing protein [Candidatus Zixiibacteriota bacterium]